MNQIHILHQRKKKIVLSRKYTYHNESLISKLTFILKYEFNGLLVNTAFHNPETSPGVNKYVFMHTRNQVTQRIQVTKEI